MEQERREQPKRSAEIQTHQSQQTQREVAEQSRQLGTGHSAAKDWKHVEVEPVTAEGERVKARGCQAQKEHGGQQCGNAYGPGL